ncbi:MAG: hypothetical protein ACLRR1_07650 [Alistipes shahii]|jgi:hypothetical protein|nr:MULTISPECIES: hypothetical protein [Alistipes]
MKNHSGRFQATQEVVFVKQKRPHQLQPETKMPKTDACIFNI